MSDQPMLSSLPPNRCPRQAARKELPKVRLPGRWIRFADLHREPFRLFFPAAVIAGLIGVALWPVMLMGWTANYPGPSHARLMIQGFFGGFIFGFLGTSMPRFVDAAPLSAREAFILLALFIGNVSANACWLNPLADGLFIAELGFCAVVLSRRVVGAQDRPPPSFTLVALAFASGVAGTALQIAGRRWELSPPLELFSRLLSYHGFVLLCVLGAGGFLLPRFLGLGVRRKFPESSVASPEWKRAAGISFSAGFLILLSFGLEAVGWNRFSGTLRAVTLAGYLVYEIPLERLRWNWHGVHWHLILGLICIPLGILAAGWYFKMRLTMLHVELIGGFSLITFGVATRVVYGHSGARAKLERFHPWLTAAIVLMLLGLLSRVSGDFLPAIQRSHYLYGAGCWMLGAIMWSICVLPKVLRPDPEA